MGRVSFQIDSSLRPVLVITLMGAPHVEDYERMFDEFERALLPRERYLTVTDVRALTRIATAAERQVLADRALALYARPGATPIGSIVIVESSIVRGGLTAMRWLTRHEMHAVASMEDALAQAGRMLTAAGLPVPAGLGLAESG